MNNEAVRLTTDNLENIIETTMAHNTHTAIWIFEQYLHPSTPNWDDSRYVVRFSDPQMDGADEFGIVSEGVVLTNPDYYQVVDSF